MIPDVNLGPELELKNYYRGTYQLRRHIEEEWSRYLEVVQFYPAAIDAFQDIVVLKKN
jgi:hypothetical protein